MSSIEEGGLTYFTDPQGNERNYRGDPRPATPSFCPICGRRLIYSEWSDHPTYPMWRCDGAMGTMPLLGALWRGLSFARGRHYTFSMPPFIRQAERSFDSYTGDPL